MTDGLRAALCACLVSMAALAGCANAPDADGGRDRVTESDESDSARRARVRLELAAAYFGRGQLETALDEVKQAIAAQPNLAPAFNLRGLIYAGLGDERLAEESFRRALQLDPRDADVMQNFGWYLCQARRYAEADALFRQALATPLYVNAPRTLMTQGICHARAGQWAAAQDALSRALELEPGSPVIAVNLSEVLYRQGDLQRARSLMRRVNGNADVVNAQTLWLGMRIENRLGNRQGVAELGTQLRNRFPQSREATAYEQGRFDD